MAAFLNRLLGRYVEDLDTEQFNVGIFSGETYLTDLKLRPEALVSSIILFFYYSIYCQLIKTNKKKSYQFNLDDDLLIN